MNSWIVSQLGFNVPIQRGHEMGDQNIMERRFSLESDMGEVGEQTLQVTKVFDDFFRSNI
jgi:hypothetical protein